MNANAGRLTDERLKSWLNADQAARERMCAGILALDRSYTDIVPRRPEGGPDGGRDIECRRLGQKCFGAVGFLNHACDSKEQKKKLLRKFRDDIQSARDGEPTLKAFVFMCNIDF